MADKTVVVKSGYNTGYQGKTWNDVISIADLNTKIASAGIPTTAKLTDVRVRLKCYYKPKNALGNNARINVDSYFTYDASQATSYKLMDNTSAVPQNNAGTITSTINIVGYFNTSYPFNVKTDIQANNPGFSIRFTTSNAIDRTYYIDSWELVLYYEEHNHSYITEIARTPSTCYTQGSVTKQCSCGEPQTKALALDPNNHAGGTEIRNAVAATCTAEGYTGDTYCKGCGAQLSNGTTIAKIAHTEVTIPAVAPTCTETGLTEGKKCSVCGEILIAQTIIPALGHDYSIVNEVDPTSTANGYTEYTCSRCGHSKRENYTCRVYGNTSPINAGVVGINGGSNLATVNYGDTITLTAKAIKGYTFVQWEDGSTANPRTVTVTNSITYIAVFEEGYQITLRVDTEKGTITGANDGDYYKKGSTLMVTATAKPGYKFNCWNIKAAGSDYISPEDNPYTFTLTGNTSIFANFIEEPPEILSAQLIYGDQQVSQSNKVKAGEGFRIIIDVQ